MTDACRTQSVPPIFAGSAGKQSHSPWLAGALFAGLCATTALGCTADLTGPGAYGSSPNGGGGAGQVGSGGSGTVGSGGTASGPTQVDDDGRIMNPPAFQPAVGMVRRLTRSQFRNAVRDIFGVEVDVTKLDSDIGQFAAIGAGAQSSARVGEQGVIHNLCVESSRLVSVLEMPSIRRMRPSTRSNASRLSARSSATMSQRPLVL